MISKAYQQLFHFISLLFAKQNSLHLIFMKKTNLVTYNVVLETI